MTTAQTASEAFDRYMKFLGDGALIQKSWHQEKDGRQLACALGVIGSEIDSPSDCPAEIMPRWLAQMVPWLFDNQELSDATDWGQRFYAELKRLDGKVPFSVVYDWHAKVVCPLAIEVAEKRNRKTEAHEALRLMHESALAGNLGTRDEWFAKLRNAYANANADADANSYADADADANSYADADADADADANSYADADADANSYAYANANAYAYANANANAYANSYANANSYAYAYAYANANANAYANSYANANSYAYAYRKSIKRLADGLVECLARVQTPEN